MALAISAIERADGLRMTLRESISFVERHRDLFVRPVADSLGALARIRRWYDAGRPQPDLKRLVYCGHPTVGALLRATLAKLPDAIGWFATEHVTWLEVGRADGGWARIAPLMRTPIGDRPHLVNLAGAESDERMPHIFVHELAHNWHRPLVADEPHVPMPDDERQALVLRVLYNDDVDAMARSYWAGEILADETAAALGFKTQGHSSDFVRLRGFREQIAAVAADRAAIPVGDNR
jgi:hypothetical protein